jgi:hypothetical protein
MSKSEVLDMEIRALVAELIESAPPAPSIPELEPGATTLTAVSRWRRFHTTSRSEVFALGGVTAVAAATVLVVLLLSSTGQRIPSAAAAQLRLIAENLANQTEPQLQRNEWLETHIKEEWSMDLESLGQGEGTPVPGAEAAAAVSATEWSNNFGESCYSLSIGEARFASVSNEEAWHAAGLTNSPQQRDAPFEDPTEQCESTTSNASNGMGLGFGIGTTRVATLPTDPSTLAHELTTGTTGIEGLDQLPIDPGQNPGFQRVVDLLTTDLSDQTPAFYSALYDALALMPGVHALGETVTHTGSTGLGFDAPNASLPDATVIVVDPTNGALVEVRNLWAPGRDDPFGAFVGPQSPFEKQGGGLHDTIQWLDPIGTPSVVHTADLPPTLAQQAGPLPTALITATASLHVSTQTIDTLETQILSRFNAPGSGAPIDSELRSAPSPEVLSFTFYGPESQVHDVANVLQSSALFASVDVDYGDG